MASAAYLAAVQNPNTAWFTLAEIQIRQALIGWTSDTLGAYYIAHDLYTHPTSIRADRGLYRGVDSVWEGLEPLTAQSSVANVRSNSGSFFYDATSGRIYVRTSGAVNPDTLAIIQSVGTLRFASTPVSFSDQPPYHSDVAANKFPTVRIDQSSDPLLGVSIYGSGDLTLQNADAFWDYASVAYLWANNTVQFKVGADVFAYSDCEPMPPMQVVQPPTAGTTSAIFQLRALSNILDTAFPMHTVDDYFGLHPFWSIKGTYMPMWWGTVLDRPLLDLSEILGLGAGIAGKNRFLAIDPFMVLPLDLSRIEVIQVRAYDKATGAMTVVTDAHYAELGQLDVDPAFDPTTYELRADMRRLSDVFSGNARELYQFGTIIPDMFTWAGAPSTTVDAAGFAATVTDAPQTLGVYVSGGSDFTSIAQTLGDIINKCERSVLGSVHTSSGFTFTATIWTPFFVLSDLTVLDDVNITGFEPDGSRQEQVASAIRLRYAENGGTGAWSTVTSSSDAAAGQQGLATTLDVDTLLVEDTDAANQAARLRKIAQTATQRTMVSTRADLLNATPWQKFRVTRPRGPSLTGTVDTVLELLAATKNMSAPSVTATLGNQRGLGIGFKLASHGLSSYGSETPEHHFQYAFAVASGSTLDHGRAW